MAVESRASGYYGHRIEGVLANRNTTFEVVVRLC